jgi:hypothetical protein
MDPHSQTYSNTGRETKVDWNVILKNKFNVDPVNHYEMKRIKV